MSLFYPQANASLNIQYKSINKYSTQKYSIQLPLYHSFCPGAVMSTSLCTESQMFLCSVPSSSPLDRRDSTSSLFLIRMCL